MIATVKGYRSDRAAAIARFQSVEDIRDDTERADGVIRPDGLTWQTLFTLGEIARGLEDESANALDPVDYRYTGGFREDDLVAEATRRFAADRAAAGRFNAASVPALLDIVGRIGRDPRIVDIRWMAYMLATVMWETNHLVTVRAAPPRRRARRCRVGAHRSKSPARAGSTLMTKDYYLPVKVQPDPAGGATVTKQDGDVIPNGRWNLRSHTR